MTKATSVLHGMLEQLDEWTELPNEEDNDERNPKKKKEDMAPPPITFPLGGANKRIDYQLQPSVIDNEYVSAVLAHSTYFCNYDVIDFVIDLASGDNNNNNSNSKGPLDVPGCIEVNEESLIPPSPLPPKSWSSRAETHLDAASDVNVL